MKIPSGPSNLVWKVDSAIDWQEHHPVDNAIIIIISVILILIGFKRYFVQHGCY